MSQLLSTKTTALLPAAGVLCGQFLKFQFEYLVWIRPFHTAENQYPTVCKTATVMPNRSPFGIPISTSLMRNLGQLKDILCSLMHDISKADAP